MNDKRDGADRLSSGDVELVVVAYRSRAQVEGMLEGLPQDLPVVVVDNSDGSDGLEAVLSSRANGRYVVGGGVGFARAANLGASTSTARVLVFVNPDTRPTPADIASLVADVVTDDRCAASAAVLLDDEGGTQLGVAGWEPSIRRVLVHGAGLHKKWPRAGVYARPALGERLDVDWVSGACMAVRREVFERLGGFDSDYYVYLEDVTFGRTARAAGMYERLRTDIGIAGSSGGSGAPSLEMMRLRGASMTYYLRKHHPALSAYPMAWTIGLGYTVRTLEQLIRGDRRRAREHWAYAAGSFSSKAHVAGRQVMGPWRRRS